jgi:hypothetical protein
MNMAENDLSREEVTRAPGLRAMRLPEMFRGISWGAVWAGVMIALGMEALLTMFGLFVGFRMYDWQAANPWRGITAWSTIWYFVTVGWSMFFGAWCAARLSGLPVRESGILHGITVWGLATFATMATVTVGSWAILREGINVLSTAATTVASTVPGAIPHAVESAQPVGPVAQATAHTISSIALGAWLGVLIGLVTAILGGARGRVPSLIMDTRETPVSPRIAA